MSSTWQILNRRQVFQIQTQDGGFTVKHPNSKNCFNFGENLSTGVFGVIDHESVATFEKFKMGIGKIVLISWKICMWAVLLIITNPLSKLKMAG